ncbi:MAG: glucose 1-dehydrogenase [Thermoanaerobacterales bacterium]|jgi:3alpha(or 20beta)-hydroxysteroid dehydrogenase|nr:glucose 1-dehydrogenase [Thermoanaerobacterales bacterium]
MGRLEGKVAIITGAARGQGEAEARLFVAEGARVLLADIRDEEGEAVAADLGDAAAYVHLDVTDAAQWEAAVAHAEERFGPVSVLVNNAGILHFAPIDRTDPEDFERVLRVNVHGVFLGIRAVTPSMVRAGGGSIVNISSTAGLQGLPSLGAYVASKWAVRGLTKTAAMDLGPKGIRVNSVHPGGIDTPMVAGTPADAPFYKRLPVPRMGRPEEAARAVLFLASDESSYVTGAELAVDGGATCGDHAIMS